MAAALPRPSHPWRLSSSAAQPATSAVTSWGPGSSICGMRKGRRLHVATRCHIATHLAQTHLTDSHSISQQWQWTGSFLRVCVSFVCHCVCLGLKNVEDIYLIRSHQHCHQIASRCCGTLWASGDIWCIWWRNGMCRRLGASAPPLRARLLPHCQTWPRHLSLGPTIKAMITRMDPQLGSLF